MKTLIYDSAYIEVPNIRQEEFIEKFSFWNPKYRMAMTLGVPTAGMDPKIICAKVYKTTCTGTVYRVPRFFAAIDDMGIPACVEDSTAKNRKYPFILTTGLQLRPVQEKAIDAYIQEAPKNNGTGIIALACGKGKTILGINLIHKLQAKTLILVDQDSLAKQWSQNIQTWLNGYKASLWIQDENEIGPITIATLQSLWRHHQSGKLPANFFSQFSLTISDECHILPAQTFMEVAMNIRSQYILGLSATLVRADGLTKLINSLCGPVVYQDLETDVKPVVEYVNIAKIPYEISNFINWLKNNNEIDPIKKRMIRQRRLVKFVSSLTEFEYRNKIIVNTIIKKVTEGHINLVLCARKEHCAVLCKMLEKFGIKACVVTGEIKGKKREDLYNKVRSGEIQAILVTTVAKKGLDIPSISAVHITYPVKSEETVVQAIGRGCRFVEGKMSSLIVDYYEEGLEESLKCMVQRRKIYVEKGWL